MPVAITVFNNTAVFDGVTLHLLENHSVVVEGGKIVELAQGNAPIGGAKVIDAGLS